MLMESRKLSSPDRAIELALRCSLTADEPHLVFLPGPVRYRAAGAIRTWPGAFRLSGDD